MQGIELQPVGGFQTVQYFQAFEHWLDQHVTVGNLVEEPVGGHNGPRTRLFRVRGGDEVWQLVAPEEPFPGVFDLHHRLNRPSQARRFVWPLVMLGFTGLVAALAIWAAFHFWPLLRLALPESL